MRRGGPQGKDDQASRKDRILQAASDEFADKGFAAARVEEIARRAGANKQLIYYYFGSKAGLYDAVVTNVVSSDESRFMPGPDASVDDLIDTLLMTGSNAERTKLGRLLAWAALEDGATDSEPIRTDDATARALRYQTRLVEKAGDAGRLAEGVHPGALSLLLTLAAIGPVAFPQVARPATGFDPGDDELWRVMAQTLKSLLMPPR
jgi:AcrR family transcriptional regulator